jgi:hypothetical protein
MKTYGRVEVELHALLTSVRNSVHLSVLCQMNPVHNFPSCVFKMHFNIILTYVPYGHSLPVFLRKVCMHFCPVRATCLAYLVLHDVIILIISREEYKLRSSALCSLLQPRVTSSLMGPNIPLSTPSSNTLSLYSSFHIRGQVWHPYRTTDKFLVEEYLLLGYDAV